MGEIENLGNISKLKEKLESKAPKLTVGQPFPFTRNLTTVKENYSYQSKVAETEIRSCDKLNSFGQENCSDQLDITTWIIPD